MMPRSELINVSAGAGRLQLRGAASAFALFVDDRSVAANWYDCEGSIGQYFYRVPGFSLEQCAALAREAVRDAPPTDRPLADRFRPLLDQFASGTYRLDYDEASAELRFWELNYTSDFDSHDDLYHYANHLRFEHALLPTQNTDTRDQRRILEWAAAIEAGQRPTLITAMVDGADTELVLDGHHKLSGYELAGVPPCRLAIVCLDPPPLRLEDWPGGRVRHHPESWPKALALKPRLWPRDAHPRDVAFEYQHRAEIARRLGAPAPNLVGFLEASYVYLYDYSPDFTKKHPRGWITSPAALEVLEPCVKAGLDGGDIVRVAVVDSRTSSGTGLEGWVPLVATTFTEYFDHATRTVAFRNKKLV
jgi:hypothetical protein